MSHPSRQRIKSFQEWHNFIQSQVALPDGQGANLYEMRAACYRDIEQVRGKPLLIYAVQYPFDGSGALNAPIAIETSDVDGFADLVEAANGRDDVDVLIHSPGGSAEATERIVQLLRRAFKTVTFLVPHSAFSAATMLAMSGDEIILHPDASLGPIDPQINGIPARSIRRGFDRVREELATKGPESLPAYIPLIEKLSIELLEICDDALSLSKELVRDWLTNYMFKGEDSPLDRIDALVEAFSDYDRHKTHSRPLTVNRLVELGLPVVIAEEPLRGLLREAHILLSGFFSVSPFVKLFENGDGLTWGRQFSHIPIGHLAPN